MAGDGRLFVVSQAGVLSVLRTGAALTPDQTLDLGDEIYATPALSDGAVFGPHPRPAPLLPVRRALSRSYKPTSACTRSSRSCAVRSGCSGVTET